MVGILSSLMVLLTILLVVFVYVIIASSRQKKQRKAKRFEFYKRMLLHLEDIYAREALGYEDEGALGFCFMITTLRDSEDLPPYISDYPELWAHKPSQYQIKLYGGFWWQSDDRISRINVLREILQLE